MNIINIDKRQATSVVNNRFIASRCRSFNFGRVAKCFGVVLFIDFDVGTDTDTSRGGEWELFIDD